MPQSSNRTRNGRLQLFLVAAAFIGPLLLATWLYFAGFTWQPAGRSNHGLLLEPIINLGDTGLTDIDQLTGAQWLLVYAEPGVCAAACRDSLYKLRQSRLMLGNEMNRLQRIFLHGDAPPDRVFLEEQHAGLTSIRNDGLGELLQARRPAESTGGGFFLVDPLGNLVMYFAPEINPRDLVDDIKHLLDLSRIG